MPNKLLQMAKISHQFGQTEAMNTDEKQADNSDNEQELRGCGAVTSFAWGSSCREEKVCATLL